MNKDTIEKLKELQGLYATGIISEAEFTSLKKDALNNTLPEASMSSESTIHVNEPQKRMHTVRNVVIGLLSVVLLLVAGYALGSGYFKMQKADEPKSAAMAPSEQSEKSASSSTESKDETESHNVSNKETSSSASQGDSSSLSIKDSEGYTLGGAYTSEGKPRYATLDPEMVAVRERLLKRWGETSRTAFDPKLRLVEATGGFNVVKGDDIVGKITDKGNGLFKFIILIQNGANLDEVTVGSEVVK